MISTGVISSSNSLTAKVPGETSISLQWNRFSSSGTLFLGSIPVDNSAPVSYFIFDVYDQGAFWYSRSTGGPTGQANVTLNPYSFGTIVASAYNPFGSGPVSTISWTGGFA